MKKIIHLISQYPDLTINVKLSDLLESNRLLIQEAKEQLEKQVIEANEESYQTIDEAATLLDVSKSTLWRWNKQGYLSHIEVGGKRRYKMSDLKKLLNGNKS